MNTKQKLVRSLDADTQSLDEVFNEVKHIDIDTIRGQYGCDDIYDIFQKDLDENGLSIANNKCNRYGRKYEYVMIIDCVGIDEYATIDLIHKDNVLRSERANGFITIWSVNPTNSYKTEVTKVAAWQVCCLY